MSDEAKTEQVFTRIRARDCFDEFGPEIILGFTGEGINDEGKVHDFYSRIEPGIGLHAVRADASVLFSLFSRQMADVDRRCLDFAERTCGIGSLVPMVLAAKALKAFESEDYPGSIELYSELIGRGYATPNFYSNLAAGQLQLGKIEEALSNLELAIEIDPELVPAHMNRGILLERVGADVAAREAFERVIALQPGSSVGYLALGRLWLKSGAFPQSILEFDQAAACEDATPDIFVCRAECHTRLGNEKLAIADLREARRRGVERIVCDFKLSMLLFEPFFQAQQSGADPRELHNYDTTVTLVAMYAMSSEGNHKAMLGSYHKAITEGHASAEVHTLAADAYLATAQPIQALEAFTRAIELDENAGDARMGRAMLRFRLQMDMEDAVRDLEVAAANHVYGAQRALAIVKREAPGPEAEDDD